MDSSELDPFSTKHSDDLNKIHLNIFNSNGMQHWNNISFIFQVIRRSHNFSDHSNSGRNSRPIGYWTHVRDLNIGLVRYSNHHCFI